MKQLFRFLIVPVVLMHAAGCGGDGVPGTNGVTDPVLPVPTSLTLSESVIGLVFLGETHQLNPTVSDENGAPMSGQTVGWSSSDAAVASISPTGVIIAVSDGEVTITATSGALSAAAAVSVAQAADSIALSPASLVLGGPGAVDTVEATVLDAGGSPIEGAVFLWSSADAGVATVDSRGVVEAIAAGTAGLTIEATVDTQSVSQALPVLVNPTLEIATTSLDEGDKNLPYAGAALTAAGGGTTYAWSVVGGVLPPGLTLEPSGAISGTPTAFGTSVFTAQVASEDGQTAQQILSLIVNDSPYLLATDSCTDYPANGILAFEDANLESAVRSALGLAGGDDLTCALAAGLTVLNTNGAEIESLVGIQNVTDLREASFYRGHCDVLPCLNSITDITPLSGLTSLQKLDLGNNAITDISIVSGLPNLTHLYIYGAESISDLTPLSGLSDLTVFYAGNNPITDLSPLSGLTSLREIILWNTLVEDVSPLGTLVDLTGLAMWGPFTDISSLSGLTDLVYLDLRGRWDSGIEDISVVSNFTNMRDLYLWHNAITDLTPLGALGQLNILDLSYNGALVDIQPLIANAGLAAGDQLLLKDVSPALSCADIETLEARGVTVSYTSCS